MPDDTPHLPSGLPPDRRQFLAKMLLGTAYAAPLVASFSLDGLLLEPARAQGSNLCANTGKTCSGPNSNLANVAVHVVVAPKSAAPGDTVTYTVTAVNCGPCSATNAQFTQNLNGVAFVSATQLSGPTFILDTPPPGQPGSVFGEIDSFPANAVATFQIKGTVL